MTLLDDKLQRQAESVLASTERAELDFNTTHNTDTHAGIKNLNHT